MGVLRVAVAFAATASLLTPAVGSAATTEPELLAAPQAAATTHTDPAGAADTAPAETGTATAPATTGTADTAHWAQPQASVERPPAAIVAQAPADEPLRVVTVVAGPTGPQYVTETVASRAEARSTVAAAQSQSDTIAVGMDQPVQVTARDAPTNDPRVDDQWAFRQFRPDRAWPSATGTGITVAVIDTGVQANHPDLAGRVLPGYDSILRVPVGRMTDPSGHGTHVAGIIAANPNNGIGIAGWSPGTTILPVRALNSAGAGRLSDIADGVTWAVNAGADVLNLSLGARTGGILRAAIEYAQANQVTVIAAAGNDGTSAAMYPASFPGVIGVSAVDNQLRRGEFSNYGEAVDVAAPGVDVLSTVPDGGGYRTIDGTSQAAPHVTAVAAMILSLDPAYDVETILRATARDLGLPGHDDSYGAGVVEPVDAVALALDCPACARRSGNAAAELITRPEKLTQSARIPAAIPVGDQIRLPATTRQAQPIRWRSLDRTVCRIRRVKPLAPIRWRLTGRAPGRCEVALRADGTRRYDRFAEHTIVRVTP